MYENKLLRYIMLRTIKSNFGVVCSQTSISLRSSSNAWVQEKPLGSYLREPLRVG